MAFQLARNINPHDAARAFEDAARDLENRSSWGVDGHDRKDVYVQWVQGQYPMFRQYIGLSSAAELLHSTFYWYVLRMDVADPRAPGQLFQGMSNEAARVRELATELKQLATVLTPTEGWHTAVVDTNALALMQPPWQLPWSALIGAQNVRVLLPLRVIEELDKRKYSERGKISEVARDLLPQIEKRLTENNGTKVIVNDHLTIEVPILPGSRDRTLHADEEILRLCEDIKQFGNEHITLVTDDTPMRIQARARSLNAKGIDAEYRRARPEQAVDKAPAASDASASVGQVSDRHGT
jgi:rRNA-processing protein FCF1